MGELKVFLSVYKHSTTPLTYFRIDAAFPTKQSSVKKPTFRPAYLWEGIDVHEADIFYALIFIILKVTTKSYYFRKALVWGRCLLRRRCEWVL